MIRWLSRLTLLVAVFALPFPVPGHANETLRPAAVVNDEVISVLDLEMRVRLALLTSGLPDSQQQRQRVAPQVLENLIDERLQMQEARRVGVEVSSEEVDEQVQRIARGNNMSTRQLTQSLENSGVMPQIFREQIRANIAWQKVVGQRIRPEVQLGPEEVEGAVERLRAQEGEQQMQAREIFLAVGGPEAEQRVRNTAERLIQQLEQGADFEALAREFSQSATAPVGGDLGWVTAQGLPQAVADELNNARNGEIVGPVRTFSGIHIVQLMDRRRITAGEERVHLQQLFIETPPDASAEELDAAMGRLREVSREIDSCGEMSALADRIGGIGSGDLGTVDTANLPDELRSAISGLSLGAPSEPMQIGDGISVLMVCEREYAGVDRDQISDNLMRERLNLRIQRHMRDLRRDAHVDIRI